MKLRTSQFKHFFLLNLAGLLWANGVSRGFSQPKPFEYLTITEGLPHNTVFCLLQDNHQFIWAGTKDGLVRFDGYECRVFKQSSGEEETIKGKSIHALLEDTKGNLWVGTKANGITLRDATTGVFRHLGKELPFKPLANAWIQRIYEDARGRIWFGTVGSGLWRYSPDTRELKQFTKDNTRLSDNNISGIVEDENGRLWVADSGRGIYYYEEKSEKFTPFHSAISGDSDFASFRKTFFADKKGNLWVGTEGSGLYKIRLADFAVRHFSLENGLPSNKIMGISQNRQGDLLMATDGGGLVNFSPKTEVFRTLRASNQLGDLNSNALLSILVDRDDNLWVGTFNGGINIQKAHKTRFQTLPKQNGHEVSANPRSVLGICQTPAGKIYVGTDGGGLNIVDKGTDVFTPFVHQPPGFASVVKSLFVDSKNRLWVGQFENGLSLYDPGRGSYRQFRFDPAAATTIGGNNVWSVTEDQDGKLWVGILGGGIARLEDADAGIFRRFNYRANDPESLSSNDIIVLFFDKNNDLWVGTDTRGLNKLNPKTGKVTRFLNQSADKTSLSANDIRCIFQDSKGRLWIGTESGGLNRWLGDGRFEHFTVADGLISDAIMSILEDDNGYLWLSTFKGVSRFAVEKREFLNFDFSKNSYFTTNQFNQGAGVKDAAGNLYFGGINGLTFIRPNDIYFLQTKPTVVFTDFRVFNQSVYPGDEINGQLILPKALNDLTEINLTYTENVFSFEFAALDYTDPVKNRYVYKMEGFDKNWQRANSEQRLITYTNLSPGTYTFIVKGTNNSGVWSNERRMKIIISPPFWQTWWFRLLLWLFILGIGWLALRIYTTRREMAMRQKMLEYDRSMLALKNENLTAEKTILNLQKENLAKTVEAKNNELMSKAVQMAHKKEMLIEFKEQLENIKNADDNDKGKLLRNLKSNLTTEIEGESSWEQFIIYFDQINQNLTAELLKKHPNLTQNDLRMCALTRLNMSNKEKALLLNITVTGVEKSRYRLKKRLGLGSDDDLGEYLRSF